MLWESNNMAIMVRDYIPQDWVSIDNIVLNAENSGDVFLETEKRNISIFSTHSDYGRVIVAEDATTKQIVGFAALLFEWRALVIQSIITHHKHLRQGIGRRLIDRIKELAESYATIDVIRIDTGDFMNYAQKFYKDYGFIQSGYVAHYLSWNNNQIIFVFPVKR